MYLPYEIISVIQEYILDKKTMLNILLTRKEYYYKLIGKFYELVIFDKEEYEFNNSKHKKNIYCSCKEIKKYQDAINKYIYCDCNIVEMCEKRCSRNLPHRINNINIPNNYLLNVIKNFKYFTPIDKNSIIKMEYMDKLEYIKFKNKINICNDKFPKGLKTILFKWHDSLYKNIIISKIKRDILCIEKNKIISINEYNDIGTDKPVTTIRILDRTNEYDENDMEENDEYINIDNKIEVLRV